MREALPLEQGLAAGQAELAQAQEQLDALQRDLAAVDAAPGDPQPPGSAARREKLAAEVQQRTRAAAGLEAELEAKRAEAAALREKARRLEALMDGLSLEEEGGEVAEEPAEDDGARLEATAARCGELGARVWELSGLVGNEVHLTEKAP